MGQIVNLNVRFSIGTEEDYRKELEAILEDGQDVQNHGKPTKESPQGIRPCWAR